MNWVNEYKHFPIKRAERDDGHNTGLLRDEFLGVLTLLKEARATIREYKTGDKLNALAAKF